MSGEFYDDSKALKAAMMLSYLSHASGVSAKFDQTCIPVETIPNDGRVVHEHYFETAGQIQTYPMTYVNKCLFLSIEGGLHLHKRNWITASFLMKTADFMNDDMVDLDNPGHQQMLERLAAMLPDFQLHFHVGVQENQKWQTLPYAHAIYGNGNATKVIRILQKGNHFERIAVTDPAKFVLKISDEGLSRIRKEQEYLQEKIKKTSGDRV